MASVLGVIKAVCAFIPVDPKYPKGRIDQIIEDSDSRFVIVSEGIDYNGENKILVDDLLKM